MLSLVVLVSLGAGAGDVPPARTLEADGQRAIDEAAGLRGDDWAAPGGPAQNALTLADDARVKRFVGALAGGIVGAGLAMALMPLGDVGVTSCAFCSTVTPLHGFFGVLAPLLAMTGAFTGWQVMGGDGAFASTAAALLPASLVTALLLLIVPADQSRIGSALPELLTGLVMLSAFSALVLDWRQNQLEALGQHRDEASAPGLRVAAEVGMNVLGLATTTALVAVLASTVAVGGGVAGIALTVALGAVGVVGTALATWGVHRGLHGQGSFASSLLGLLVGAALGGGVALVAALGSGTHSGADFSTIETVLAVEVAAVSVLASSALALEFSHTSILGERAGVSVQVGGAPVAGGAMLAAGLRF
jgi:hypothetical protein